MHKLPLVIVFCFAISSLEGQCLEDRHTTNAVDGWISCEASTNPNPAHGSSHWIHYDLGSMRSLHDMHIWNINHPDFLDDGVKNIVIETSSDGTNWSVVDTFTLSRATGSSYYEGSAGPDLQGVSASHLLITAIDNHGGGCFGVSELKIYTEDFVPAQFNFEMNICEHDGLYKNLSGGIEEGGQYSGRGVSDNGDETFNFDASIAGPGLHEIIYTTGSTSQQGMIEVLSCASDICGGCLECPQYAQVDIDGTPIPEATYHGNELMSEGTVNQSQVIFWGNQSVEMNPNFEVTSSGLLEVDIRSCFDNMVSNSGFESGLDPWIYQQSNNATGAYSASPDAYEGVSSALIQVTQAGTSSSDVRLQYRDLSIEENKTFRLSIVAKADADRLVTVRIQGESTPYTSYINTEMALKTHWQVFSFEIVSPITRIEDVRLHFRCGLEEGDYYFDRVLWTVVE